MGTIILRQTNESSETKSLFILSHFVVCVCRQFENRFRMIDALQSFVVTRLSFCFFRVSLFCRVRHFTHVNNVVDYPRKAAETNLCLARGNDNEKKNRGENVRLELCREKVTVKNLIMATKQ